MANTKKGAKTAKAKTAKGVKAKTATVKFVPKKGIDILKRGEEFNKLVERGLSMKAIESLYRSHGIEFSNPTYFNARRIATAPKYVQAAVVSGRVTASDVLPLLKGRRVPKDTERARMKLLMMTPEQRKKFKALKAQKDREWNEKVKSGLAALIARRSNKVSSLKDAGMIDKDVNQVKMTALRTIKLVGARLAEIRKSGPIKNARALVLQEIVTGLQQGKTAEELLQSMGVKSK